MNILKQIATELNLTEKQIKTVLDLLAKGATIPFIARYRKEATGTLNEVQLLAIRDRNEQLTAFEKRREAIISSLAERNLLTKGLSIAIANTQTLADMEDIYLPYRPKRRTKATIAKEKGLEPLAKAIFDQSQTSPKDLAARFISKEKKVSTSEEALQGARDIIAEWINEDTKARSRMRSLFAKKAKIRTKVIKSKKEEAGKFENYFAWEESITKVPSHRYLAMRRGESLGFLKLQIEPEKEEALQVLKMQFIKKNPNLCSRQVLLAIEDGYKRLLLPSMETHIRSTVKEIADTEAIAVFADNLRQLLLASPLGEKNVLAIDPGFRSGCKVVCLNGQGKLLNNDVIYPHKPQMDEKNAAQKILKLVEKFKIEEIAFGNGTASRETENFLKSLNLSNNINIIMVNENGASIYSASDIARKEFPDKDITVRGAVSIGRRLMDPLSELIKIDPKSIGVGQYQYDVDQTALKKSLDDAVLSCVNAVGFELNTASYELLSYVSGLGPVLAKNIVDYRNKNGAFKSRLDLKKVKRLGEKAFEQSAGFLRIRDAKNPLDASAVHPEAYSIVKEIVKDMQVSLSDLLNSPSLQKKIKIEKYANEQFGIPTLKDIVSELSKPGRDPRKKFEIFSFSDDIKEISDLQEGMLLKGIVTNITDFGAFIDIGVHQDGLVHISQMSNTYVKHPSEILQVHQKVKVKIQSVDVEKKRIQLSMKE